MIPKHMYIAGPMTGHPGYNYQAFHRKAESLGKALPKGWAVINPANNFGGRTDLEYHIYLARAIYQVAACADSIHFMKGWEKSKGAKIEYLVAKARGLNMSFERFPGNNILTELDGIVKEAKGLVYGDRGEDYGPPTHDFTRVGESFAAMMRLDPGAPLALKALDVPLFMCCIKLSREINKPKRDNLVDLAGYILCREWVKKDLKGGE